MGTSGPHSARANRRGLASFVAFLVLFAFALGLSGSLMALAGGDSRGSALPAPQAPATDSNASTSSGGATPVTRSAPAAGKLKTASATRDDAVATPAAAPVAGLSGGDVSLDFVAAGPFTYNHATGLGSPPQFGYDNRTISKTNGVVESLEGGDFECGDIRDVLRPGQGRRRRRRKRWRRARHVLRQRDDGTARHRLRQHHERRGINTPDGGNVGLDGDEATTLSNEHLDTQGYDEVEGTVDGVRPRPG